MNKIKKSACVLLCVILVAMPVFSASAAVMLGDLDADGKVTAADARLVLRAAVGLESIDDNFVAAGDADGDGTITAADARLVLRAAVGLENFTGSASPSSEIEAKADELKTFLLTKGEYYYEYGVYYLVYTLTDDEGEYTTTIEYNQAIDTLSFNVVYWFNGDSEGSFLLSMVYDANSDKQQLYGEVNTIPAVSMSGYIKRSVVSSENTTISDYTESPVTAYSWYESFEALTYAMFYGAELSLEEYNTNITLGDLGFTEA